MYPYSYFKCRDTFFKHTLVYHFSCESLLHCDGVIPLQSISQNQPILNYNDNGKAFIIVKVPLLDYSCGTTRDNTINNFFK